MIDAKTSKNKYSNLVWLQSKLEPWANNSGDPISKIPNTEKG
jgi:hypothetical protein